jgi:transcriptional regulator with XRE-family HTH domain
MAETTKAYISAAQYKRIRETIGLANSTLCRKLGISMKQAYRYENGHAPVTETVGKLLLMFDRFGIPTDF